MFLEKIVFAIDNNTDTHTVAKFLRLIDTKRALGDLKGSMVHCIGSWLHRVDDDGKVLLEPSYMMDARDYYGVVASSGYVDDQDCVLSVPGDTRQPCSLVGPGGDRVGLSPMREVQTTDGLDNWTYVISTGKYYSC